MRRIVAFKEDPEIIARMDAVAREQGSDRSTFIRGAIRAALNRVRVAEMGPPSSWPGVEGQNESYAMSGKPSERKKLNAEMERTLNSENVTLK